MPRFRATSESRTSLQQFSILRLNGKNQNNEPLHLGSCHENEENNAYRISTHGKEKIRLLHCTHENAPDWIQFHTSHAVKVNGIETALVCSDDTHIYKYFIQLRAFLETVWTASIMDSTQWSNQPCLSISQLFRSFISFQVPEEYQKCMHLRERTQAIKILQKENHTKKHIRLHISTS